MFFFFKIPTFSRFFVADVPKAAKPLAQIDRVHGIPEQIQVSVKELALYLSDNPQSILPQYQSMQVAIGQCVQCILTFDTCIGRYWDWIWIGGGLADRSMIDCFFCTCG